jgi:8-oxo-dGTP pyrophosphatase MutT (NUDIX family)
MAANWNNELINSLSEALKGNLPGTEAQMKMTPYNRSIRSKAFERDPAPRLGAVMILLYPKNEEWYYVLMQRPDYEGTHGGQVSFPGGKKEEEDESLEQTALREANEEVGIDPDAVTVLGQLTQVYIPPSRFLVHPFLGYTTTTPNFIPDAREVKEVIETPLHLLLDESIVKQTKVKISTGFTLDTPYFDIDNRVVWGATATMLNELKEILKGL